MLELVLVLALMAVLAAVVVPNLGAAGEKDLLATVRQLRMLCRYAHVTAIDSGRTVRLNIDANEGRVWLTRQRRMFSLDYQPLQLHGLQELHLPEDYRLQLVFAQDSQSQAPADQFGIWPDETAVAGLTAQSMTEQPQWDFVEFYPDGSCSGGEIICTDMRSGASMKVELRELTSLATISSRDDDE